MQDQRIPDLQVTSGGMVVMKLTSGQEKLFRLAKDGLYVWSKKQRQEICLPWSDIAKGLIDQAAGGNDNGGQEAAERFLALVAQTVEQLSIN